MSSDTAKPPRIRRGGWVNHKALPTGPNGRALCRWCQQEVPKGRRSFCSEGCVTEHCIRTDPTFVRKAVFKRDAGVCAICRFDTEKMKRVLEHARSSLADLTGERWANLYWFHKAAADILRAIQWEDYRSNWQADHIRPVAEGGGLCGLDN